MGLKRTHNRKLLMVVKHPWDVSCECRRVFEDTLSTMEVPDKLSTSTERATVARPGCPAHNPLRRIYKRAQELPGALGPLGGSLPKGCKHALVQRPPAQELLGALGALGGRLYLNWLRSCGLGNGFVHMHHNDGVHKDAPIRGRPPRAPRAPKSVWASFLNKYVIAA